MAALCLAVVFGLGIDGALSVTAYAEPGLSSAPASAGNTITSAEAAAAAVAEAKSSGRAVRVEALTTPTQVVTAQPNGVLEATVSAAPVRREVDGVWEALDTTLRRTADGLVRPVLVDGSLTLSPGGPVGSMMARFASGDYSYSVHSPFALPAPALEGDSAIYADVLPDIDLVVVARVDGFSYNWVVKTPEAAADPRIAELSLPVDASGLTPHLVNGATAYDDADGVHRIWISAPLMWDSAGGAEDTSSTRRFEAESSPALPQVDTTVTSAEAVERGPGTGHVAPVDQVVDAESVVLKPDMVLLRDAGTVYPVVIDPSSSTERGNYTTVWSNYPTNSFWNTDHTLGVGYEGYEQNKVVRSYFQFSSGFLAGKHIVSASLNVKQIHDASCSARPTDVYRTDAISSKTTWKNQPTRLGLQSSNNSTAGCGSTASMMVEWNVTTAVTNIAAQAGEKSTFMLRAQDESDKIAWKQFDDVGAKLIVQYVTPPSVPAAGGVYPSTLNTPYACGTAAAPAVIGSRSVYLNATVHSSDAKGASLAAVYHLWAGSVAQGTVASTVWAATSIGDSQAKYLWNVPADGTYSFTAATRTVWDGTNYLDSAQSAPCYFRVDASPLPNPNVTSTAFTVCSGPADPSSCPTQGVVGIAGTVTFQPASTNVTSFHWTLNSGPEQSAPVAPGASYTLTVMPTQNMNVLTVWAVNAAGTQSGHPQWRFRVAPPTAADIWNFDTGDGTANSVSSTGMLALNYNVVRGPGRIGGRSLHMAGQFASTTPDSTVRVDASFTASVWVRLGSDAPSTFLAAPSSSETANSFEFGYEPSTHSWIAGRRLVQGPAASFSGVTSAPGSAGLNRWTHLAATFDQPTGTLSLYVNGNAVGSYHVGQLATANAGWLLGCGMGSSVLTRRCAVGALDEVVLYRGALPADQIKTLANPRDSDTGQNIISSEARWDMAVGSAAGIMDSRYGAVLTVSGSHTLAIDPDDGTTSLDLPGLFDQGAQAAGPIIDTLGSFSIAARVELGDPERDMVIAQGDGPAIPAWTLGYRAVGDGSGMGQWYFNRSATTSPQSPVVEARTSPQPFDGYHVVIGTYDASDNTLHISYGGIEDGTQGAPPLDSIQGPPFTTAWQTDGDFNVANGFADGGLQPFVGNIDYLEIFAGALLGDAAFQYAWGDVNPGAPTAPNANPPTAPVLSWYTYPGGGDCVLYFDNTALDFQRFEWTIDDGPLQTSTDPSITISHHCELGLDYTANVRVVDSGGEPSSWVTVTTDYLSWS